MNIYFWIWTLLKYFNINHNNFIVPESSDVYSLLYILSGRFKKLFAVAVAPKKCAATNATAPIPFACVGLAI